jgi:uncharacterized repeat protein (TIGR02543 family)
MTGASMRNTEGTMRKAALAILLVAAFAACRSPTAPASLGGKASIVVGLGARGRTVVPDFASAITNYAITLTNTNPGSYTQKTGSATAASPTCTIVDIEPGDWTLSVVASNVKGNVGSGSVPVLALVVGETRPVTVPIAFTKAGMGDFSFTVTFPATKTDSAGMVHAIDGVSATLSMNGSDLTTALGPSASGTSSPHTFSATDLPAGSDLDLVIKLRSGGTALGTYTESVNLYDNQTSSMWISGSGTLVGQRDFTAGELYDSNAELAQLQLSSTPDMASPPPPAEFTFSSGTLAYSITAPTSMLEGYLVPTQSIQGQNIETSINGGATWTPLPSGQQGTISLTPGITVDLYLRVTAPDGTTKHSYQITIVTGYQISYDANLSTSGTPPSDGTPYRTGQVATILGNTGALAKKGYVFSGWNTQPDGLGIHYAPSAAWTAASADLTLYAEWTANTEGGTVTLNNPIAPVLTLSGSSSTLNRSFGQSMTILASNASYGYYHWSVSGGAVGSTPPTLSTDGSPSITLSTSPGATSLGAFVLTLYYGSAAAQYSTSLGFQVVATREVLYSTTTTGSSITAYALDPATGSLGIIGSYPAARGAGSLAITPNKRFLYAASASQNRISAFAIDQVTGALTALGSTAASAPEHIIVNPAGSFLYTADVAAGKIYCIAIDGASGQLSATPYVQSLLGSAPLPAAMAINPSGTTLFVADKNDPAGDGGAIERFSLDAGSGNFSSLGEQDIVGSNGTGLSLSPAGDRLYYSGSAGVQSFPVDAGGNIPISPDQSLGLVQSGRLAMDPLGVYLYTAGVSGLTGMGLSPSLAIDAFVAVIDQAPLALDPTGKVLVATDRSSGMTLSSYTIDRANGAISPGPGSTISPGAPVGEVAICVLP